MIRRFLMSACLITLVEFAPATAPAGDINGLVDQLTRSLTEDIQRQRLRAHGQDTEELRRAQLPDLSQFGTPVQGVGGATSTVTRRRSVDCTTINMGDGDSATHCD